jgi:hypothetical protein
VWFRAFSLRGFSLLCISNSNALISAAFPFDSTPLRLQAIHGASNPRQVGSFQHYAIPIRFNAVQFHFYFNPRFSLSILSYTFPFPG